MNKKNFNLCFKGLMIAFVFSLMFSVAVCPCASAATTWSKTYGGTGYDIGSGETFQTSDGGYVVSGDTNSSGAGGMDFWLFRTDAMGNMLWDKTYGGAEDETIGEMCPTKDGGYALAGSTYSFGAGDQDVWLVKTDASGNMQWSNTYGGTGLDLGFSVAQANDGGYVVFGLTESFGAGGRDFYLVKTDSAGNMEWDMTYGGSGNDFGTKVVRSSGGYTISGYSNSFGDGSRDYWLAKTDLNGILQWNYTYGMTSYDERSYYMMMTSDGGYVLGGYTTKYNYDAYVVKTDSAGNMEWNQTYGESIVDIGLTAIQTADGGYAITGQVYITGTNIELFVFKTDSAGNKEWYMTYGGEGAECPYSIVQTADGGYVLTGSTTSFGAGMEDVYLVKIDASGMVSDETWDWPMFRYDLQNTGYTESPAPNTNQTLWTFTGMVGGSLCSPAVVDGRVYVGDWTSKLYCLDAATGASIWNYTTGGGVTSSPAVANGKVYVGSTDFNVYCLDAVTGALIWNYTTGGEVYSSPSVVEGKVYIGSLDGNVYCLDASTGALIWNYTTGDAVYVSAPIVANGKIYFGSNDDNVYCLDAPTGALIWNYTTGDDVVSVPVVANGKVFVGSNDDNMYCLSAATGAKIWSYTTGDDVNHPGFADGKVYVGSLDHNLYCLDGASGALIWKFTTPGGVVSPPAIADGKVFFGAFDGYLYCLNAATGDLVWSFDALNTIFYGGPAVANGVVYVAVGPRVHALSGLPAPIPEGLTIGVMLLLSTIAFLVSARYFRRRQKWENW